MISPLARLYSRLPHFWDRLLAFRGGVLDAAAWWRGSPAGRRTSPTKPRRRLGLEALESRVLLTASGPAVAVTGLFDTGLDAQSHLLAPGTYDQHYTIVTRPDGGALTPRAFQDGFPLPPVGPYVADGADSLWVSPNPDGTQAEPVGDYVYQTTFTLSGDDLTGFALTGRWATDNGGIDILVNGVSQGVTTPSADFQFHDFTLSSGLELGTNTIQFVVHNDTGDPDQNPTALRVEFDQAAPVTPPPPLTYIPTLFDTGVDDTNAALSGGATDTHWQLESSPDPSFQGPQAAVLDDGWPVAPYGPWVANAPDVRWVSPRADDGGTAAPGDYTYETTFDLTGMDPSQVTIAGTWASDNDGVDILVNGVSTGFTTPFEDFQPHAFSLSGGFVSGLNTLEFVVHNGTDSANPTGLRVEFANTAPPTVVDPGDQSVTEGHSVSLAVQASGVGPLLYTADDLPGGLSIDPDTGVISGDVAYADAASGSIASFSSAVTVAGSSGVQTVVSVVWTVTDTNRLPSPGPQSGSEGQSVSLDMAGTDHTGTDTLAYSAVSLPHGLHIDPATGLISGVLAFDNATDLAPTAHFTPTVTLTDDHGGTDYRTLSWSVVNDTQALTLSPSQSVSEGDSISLYAGPDHTGTNGLTYGSSPLPQGLTLNASTGLISGVVGYSIASGGSTASLTDAVTLSDSLGLLQSLGVTWSVTDTNRLPSPGPQSDSEGQSVSLDMEGTDNTGTNTLTYSESDLPAGLSIDADTGLISGVIGLDNADTLTPTVSFSPVVTLTDDHGGTDYRTLSWDVTDAYITAVDDEYTLDANAAFTVAASLGVLANDDSSSTESLTVSLETGPSHGSLTLSADGSFVYTPTDHYFGDDSFTYTADDSTLTSEPATVSLSVVRDDTTTSLEASPTYSLAGETVTFTATVDATASGGGTPTGDVTFFDGDDELGTASLVAGTAEFDFAFSTPGEHPMLAVYAGVSDYLGSSASLTYPVSELDADPISSTEGETFEGAVATFIPASGDLDPDDYAATIDWGAGETDATLVPSGDGFEVVGSHEYASAGTYDVSITVTHGSSETFAVATTADVADAPRLGSDTIDGGDALSVVEGRTFTGALISLTDVDPGTTYTASIDWGDGGTAVGDVVADGDAGSYLVYAEDTGEDPNTHAYSEAGSYLVSVTVTGTRNGVDSPVTFYRTMQVEPYTWSGGADGLSATAGLSSGEATVAEFGASSSLAPTGGLEASIDWGDGSGPEGGTVVDGEDGVEVETGGHTYAHPGTFVTHIRLLEGDVSVADAFGTVTVSPKTGPGNLSAAIDVPAPLYEGVAPAPWTLATITDVDPALGAGAFAAQVDWGDGTGQQLAAVVLSGGELLVKGTHAYAAPGSYPVGLVVTGPNGSSAVWTTAVVSDDLTASGNDLTVPAAPAGPVEAVLGSFTSVDVSKTGADYEAAIDWGDGTPIDTGLVTGSGGVYYVSGAHAYDQPGVYSVRIEIRGADWSAEDAPFVMGAGVTAVEAVAGTEVGSGVLGWVVDSDEDDPRGAAGVSVGIDWGDSARVELGDETPWSYALTSTGYALTDLTTPTPTLETTVGTPADFADASVTFHDADLGADASDYTATIDWGDDTSLEAGSVASTDGSENYTVTGGSHAYALAGAYQVLVSICDAGWSLGIIFDVEVDPAKDAPASVGSLGSGVYPVSGTAAGVAGHVYGLPGTYDLDISSSDPDAPDGDTAADVAWDEPLVVSGAPLEDLSSTLAGLSAAPGVATGPVVVSAFHDTSPYGRLADYSAVIDWGDGTTSVGTVVRADYPVDADFEVTSSGHVYARPGSYQISVLVEDDGWELATTLGAVASVPTPAVWTASATERQDDGTQGTWVPLGEAMVSPNTGDVRLSEALDFDQSPGTAVGGDPALVYDSGSVAPPVIEVTLPTSGSVTDIHAVLIWAGVAQTAVTFEAGGPDGTTYVLDLPVGTPVTAGGLYQWQVDLTVDLDDGTQAVARTSGTSVEVVNSSSPYGAGWDLSGVGRLLVVPQGVLRIDGTGAERFFSAEDDGTFDAPAGDFGVLESISAGGYEYTAADQTVYTYDVSGDLTSVTDRDGVETGYSYSAGLLTGVHAPDGGETTLHYDATTGLLASVVEPGGRTLAFAHDSLADLTGLTDADGETRDFAYATPSDHLLTGDDWAPYDTTFTYGGAGRVVGVALGGAQSYAVEPAALVGLSEAAAAASLGVAVVTDGDGDATTYTLEAERGWLTREVRPAGVTTSAVFDDDGDVTEETDADGRATGYAYDGSGDVTEVDDPDGGTWTYEYDPTFHEMTQQVDPDGRVTDWAYDPDTGDLLSEVDGAGTSAAATTGYTWSDGLLETETDADGDVTSFGYDSHRREVSQTTEDAGSDLLDDEAFDYDGAGDLADATVGVGGGSPLVTHTDYDGRGLLLDETDPAGFTTSDAYDAAGLVTSSTDAVGLVSDYSFDAGGYLTEEVDDVGTAHPRTTSLTVDGAGDETASTDPAGNSTTMGYDGAGRVTSTLEYDAGHHLIGSTSYALDGDGNVLSSTDGDGNVTSYTYDAMDRETSESDYDSSSALVGRSSWTYDHVGDVVTQTDGDGNVTSYTYDALDRQTGEADYDSSSTLVGRSSWTFDGVGDVLTSTDGDGNVTSFTYDGLGRQTASRAYDSLGTLVGSMSSAFDLDGFETSETDGDGNVTSFTYDGDGDVTSEKEYDASGTLVWKTSATYDGDQNVLTSTDGDGNVTSNTYFGYDLLSTVVENALGATVSSESETYDLDDDVLTDTDGDGNVTSYTYSGNDLVATVVTNSAGVTVSSEAETYDLDQNVLTDTDGDGNVTSYTYKGNLLLSTLVKSSSGATVSSDSETYDLDQNVLTDTDGDGNVTAYTYKGGELLSTVLKAVQGTVTTTISSDTETYDLDQNVLTDTDGDGNVTSYTYDGGELVATVVKDSAGATVSSDRETYDLDQNVLTDTDGDADVTSYTYKGDELVSTVMKSSAGVTISSESETYDLDQNVLTDTDGDGNVTSYAYSGDELVSTLVKSALGATVSSDAETYDLDQNVLTDTDGDGNVTSYTYSGNELVSTVVTSSAGVTISSDAETYDLDGNVVTDTDGDGNVTSYAYKGNELVSTVVESSAGVTISSDSETYDLDQNVLTDTDGDGNVTAYTYKGGLLLRTVLEAIQGTVTTTISGESETYDLDQNVLTDTDGDGNVTSYTYKGGLLVSTLVKSSAGVTISSDSETFDLDQNVLTDTDGDGNVTSYTYSGNELVSTVMTSSAGVTISSDTETFDQDENVLTDTDGDGNVTSYTYSGNELVSTVVKSSAGATISSESETYDLDGNVVTDTDGDGNVTSYTYSGDELVSTVVKSSAGVTISSESETYDRDGNVLTDTDGDGNVTSYTFKGDLLVSTLVKSSAGVTVSSDAETYDLDGNVVTDTDGDGNVTSYTYSGNELVSTILTSSAGVTISSETETYDRDGNVLTDTDGDGNVTSYTYRGDEVISTVLKSSAGTTISSESETYDLDGNVLTSTDGDGIVTGYAYGGGELLSTVVKAVQGTVTTTISSDTETYDLDGNVVTDTDGDGNVTSYTYKGDELVSTVVKGSAGATVSSEAETYDLDGNVLTDTDGDGNVTSFTYSGNELLSTVLKAVQGTVTTTISSDAQTYDLDGNVVTDTDGDGNVTSYTYSGNELVSTVVKAVQGTVTTTISSDTETYDLDGNVLTDTDGDGNVTSYTYRGNELLSTVLKAVQGTVTTTISSESETYDLDGNVLTDTDGDGNVTSYTYSGDELVSTVMKDFAGTTVGDESMTYDLDGNVVTDTDGDGDVTTNAYLGGRLASTTVGTGTSVAAVTSFTYDLDGDTLTETDPDGNVTSFTYDAAGRVLTETDALGTTTSTFDEEGDLLSRVDPTGRTISYSYLGGRMAGQTWFDALGSVTDVLAYTYDLDGNLLTASSDAGGYTFTYVGDRLATQVGPDGVTLSYGHDEDGNVTSITDSLGGVTTESYEGGRLSSESYEDGTSAMRVDFEYDAEGDVRLATRYADLAGTTPVGSTIEVHDDGRLTDEVQEDASGSVVAAYGYSYDTAGRLTQETDNGVSTLYGYDATGQLVSAGAQSFSFDANGDDDASGTSIGPDNELLSDGTWSYTYDLAGNTSTKSDSSTGVSWSYSYDVANELTGATETSGGVVVLQASYTYDVFGNRISVSVTQGGVTTTTKSAFAAVNSPMVGADLTNWRLYSDSDGGGTLETHYVGGAQPDVWLAEVVAGAGVRWTLADRLGSVRLVTDDTGSVIDAIDYDAWGAITTESAPSVGGKLKWDGYVQDVTGFYEAGYRYLDGPRFVTQDPTGLGPDSNPYRYASNAPTDGTDPSGLQGLGLGGGGTAPLGGRSGAAGPSGGLGGNVNFGAPYRPGSEGLGSGMPAGSRFPGNSVDPLTAARYAREKKEAAEAAKEAEASKQFWAKLKTVSVAKMNAMRANGLAQTRGNYVQVVSVYGNRVYVLLYQRQQKRRAIEGGGRPVVVSPDTNGTIVWKKGMERDKESLDLARRGLAFASDDFVLVYTSSFTPPTGDPKLIAAAIKKDDENFARHISAYEDLEKEANLHKLDAILTTALHVVPTGAALDNATQGKWDEAILSGVGDLAMLAGGVGILSELSGTRTASALVAGGAGLDAAVGAVRTGQAIFALKAGKNGEAAGYIGEAFLRLLGVSLPLIKKLKDAGIAKLAAEMKVGSASFKETVGSLTTQFGRFGPKTKIHEELASLAKSFGFNGEVIVLKGSGPVNGFVTQDQKILVMFEDAFKNGATRNGVYMNGRTIVAHEVGHTIAGPGMGLANTAGNPGKGTSQEYAKYYRGEANTSHKAAQLPGLTEAEKQMLLSDAKAAAAKAEEYELKISQAKELMRKKLKESREKNNPSGEGAP